MLVRDKAKEESSWTIALRSISPAAPAGITGAARCSGGISQAPLPSGFRLCLANGRHQWKAGGQERGRSQGMSLAVCLGQCLGKWLISSVVTLATDSLALCGLSLTGGLGSWALVMLSLSYDPPAESSYG